jgi:hypothetical protein
VNLSFGSVRWGKRASGRVSERACVRACVSVGGWVGGWKTGTGRSAASGHASRRKRRKGASLPPTSICTPLLRTHGDVTDDRHDRCKQLTIEPFWALFFFCNSSLAQKRVSAKMWQSCPAAAAVAVLLYRVAQRFRDKCLIIKLIDKTLFKAFNFPVE